jgi:S1-C subfamily serine protease
MRSDLTLPASMRRNGLVFAVVGLMLLTLGPVRGAAGVREALERTLPATVGVEERDKSGAAANELTMATGTIVSADGLVVTTIPQAKGGHFQVTLKDGREFVAHLLVDDRRTGLKLLKIDAASLPFLTAIEAPVPIGEDVLATYCLGLKDRAAARGIVAAVDRELAKFGNDLLQIDANVGSMSAGGPVVDEEGRLRGIIAYRQTDGANSATFAVPASKVVALLHARSGDTPKVIRRARLGVQHDDSEQAKSPIVAHPIEGGAAKAAGLRDGDEMLALDEVKLQHFQDLTHVLSQRSAGDKVRLTIRRGGKEQTIDVTLAAAPEDEGSAASANAQLGTAWNSVNPAQLYLTEKDGTLKLFETVRDLDVAALRLQATDKIDITTPAATGATVKSDLDRVVAPSIRRVVAPSIRVERSDVERKLEQIGRDVLTLRQQMESLTDEMRRLQKQLSNDAGQRPGK